MTKQVNFSITRYRHTRPKMLAVYVIATVALIAIMCIVTSTGEHSINAQMMGDHGGGWVGNATSDLQEHQQNKMINGTINLEQTIFEAIGSKINTSLTQAMTVAEQSVGNDSFALAAFGAEQSGYFTYRIILGTPEMNFYNVIVDPGNGQILATQEVSQKELEKMHQEHSFEVVRGSSGSVGGFPFMIPH
ncbi:hypothetical protein BH18THE2_BH18THE2_31560 [soil metagenome]